MHVILFEDPLVPQLNPVALGKPALAISCGSFRLVDLVGRIGAAASAVVRPHVRPLLADFQLAATTPADLAGSALLVNARLVPSVSAAESLRNLAATGGAAVVRDGGALLAAYWPTPPAALGAPPLDEGFAAHVLSLGLPETPLELPRFDHPHDVVRHHLATLSGNLAYRLAAGEYREAGEGVFCGPGVVLGEHLAADTAAGPVVIDAGVNVGAHCFLRGPVYLGPHAKIIEHTSIKDGAALGHTTKIGGEVEASVVEPYTNKQHHGFIGHSYLGSWVNLGAGTCNSDLKNTYGLVNMEYAGRKVATGMQFIGAIVGDYSKTAINTGIFTGKVIGACSMVYGFVTTNVPSFVNYARLFGQVTEAPVEVMVSTQKRMFSRRGVTQRECDVRLLHAMHRLTAGERQLLGQPLSLEPLSL